MTENPIQRLSQADPVKDGGRAPAFEDVMAYVRKNAAGTPRRRPAVWSRPSIRAPLLTVATAIAVVAVILDAGGVHSSVRGRRTVPPQTAANARGPAPASLLPTHGGMRGLVYGATIVGARSTLRASFVQCTNCTNITARDSRQLYWSTTSTDGGRHWRTTRQQTLLLTFGVAPPDGRDVWQSGYTPHLSNPGFYVSHDSGRTFHVARAPAKAGGFEPVTLGAGEAWTLGERCGHGRCASSVLTGSTAGSHLARTAEQPPGMPQRRSPSTLLLIAGYGRRAYVSQPRTRQLYVTEDRGHGWKRAVYPCATGSSILRLSPTAAGVVWVTCGRYGRTHTPSMTAVRRSENAGKDWQTPGPSFHAAGDLVAASPNVAWSESYNGALSRTTDSGRSWQTVLQGAGTEPAISIQSATTATVLSTATTGTAKAHNRRTDLVTYRTTNGGAHWTHNVIHLPAN